MALKLADDGVKIGVHYYQNESAAKSTLEEVRRRGSDGFLVRADVRGPEQITNMFREVKAQFGKVDVFVANARPEAAESARASANSSRPLWTLRCSSGIRLSIPKPKHS